MSIEAVASETRCRVAIFDTSPLFSDTLCRSLQHQGLEAHAFSTDDVAEGADIVILNAESPGVDIESVAEGIREEMPLAKVLLLTRRVTPADQKLAHRLDAVGIFARDTAVAHLVSVLRDVHEGRSIPLPRCSAEDGPDSELAQLTAQERRILTLMAEGLRNDEVAQRLSISVHTVRTHVQNIHSKLGVTSRLQAVARATRGGALQSPGRASAR